jgi:hypothetical protein
MLSTATWDCTTVKAFAACIHHLVAAALSQVEIEAKFLTIQDPVATNQLPWHLWSTRRFLCSTTLLLSFSLLYWGSMFGL